MGSVVYAGSNAGRVYQYQGSGAWQDITANLGGGSFGSFNGIWASGPQDVYVVGNNSQAFHFNGTTWSPVSFPSLPGVDLMDVCGTSPTDVTIIGRNMTVFRYDGTAWKRLPFQCTADLYGGAAGGSLILFAGEKGQVYRLEH
jgi:hypothetical protein